MDDAHKELVKRLRVHFRSVNASGLPCMTPRNPDGEEAALALEALAGEVESLTQAVQAEKDEQARMDFHHMHALADLAAERERLKAALEEIGRQKTSEEMEGYEAFDADFEGGWDIVVTNARKALGDAS